MSSCEGLSVSRYYQAEQSVVTVLLPETMVLFGNVHSNANVIKISSFLFAAGNIRRLKLFSFALPAAEPNSSLVYYRALAGVPLDAASVHSCRHSATLVRPDS